MVTGLAVYERRVAAIERDIRVIREARQIAEEAPERSALDLARDIGVVLDPWQVDVVTGPRRDMLVLVTRQGGKGLAATILALDQFINAPGSKTLVISRAERQAKRLLRRIRRAYRRLPNAPKVLVETMTEFELANGSEALALPGSEATIRGEDAVDLIIIDEASRVPEDLFAAVTPMTATTDGKTVALATAFGQQGWFYEAFESESDDWDRIKVTAPEIPRIKPSFLEKERRRLGEHDYEQEYLCRFWPAVGQVFSAGLLDRAFSDELAPLFDVPEGGEGRWLSDSLSPLPVY